MIFFLFQSLPSKSREKNSPILLAHIFLIIFSVKSIVVRIYISFFYRLISPEVYRSPECFVDDSKKNIRGECFDIWSYGLLILNVMTGHYFKEKVKKIVTRFMSWSTDVWPILEKALKVR